jgi:hypothetical protein
VENLSYAICNPYLVAHPPETLSAILIRLVVEQLEGHLHHRHREARQGLDSYIPVSQIAQEKAASLRWTKGLRPQGVAEQRRFPVKYGAVERT